MPSDDETEAVESPRNEEVNVQDNSTRESAPKVVPSPAVFHLSPDDFEANEGMLEAPRTTQTVELWVRDPADEVPEDHVMDLQSDMPRASARNAPATRLLGLLPEVQEFDLPDGAWQLWADEDRVGRVHEAWPWHSPSQQHGTNTTPSRLSL